VRKIEINLKKQSQFVMAQLNISTSDIRSYGEMSRFWLEKNKANQSQFPPNGTAGKKRPALQLRSGQALSHAERGARKMKERQRRLYQALTWQGILVIVQD